MCGIAGFNWQDQDLVTKMADTIRHRGPDDQGLYADTRVSLGHRRLSILDLSEKGRQPFVYRNLVIVYNGEVYNFKDLRQELHAAGYEFYSDTDTEVVLAAYDRWGPACVERFNGMWALCIYDPDKHALFLSRDRFGVKPLYYWFDGERFIFASELKAIRVHDLSWTVSVPAVNFFFYQKYIGRDLTIFENCFKLQPGHNMTFDLTTKKLAVTPYYELEAEIARHQAVALDERLDAVEGLLVDAVERRLIADVPVGSFLSGGVDSSLISGIISQRHKAFQTFSIGFTDASYNELDFSRLVSQHIGTDHYYDVMDIDEAVIRHLLEAMDEPFGDASLFPTYLLSQIARRKVTVCLSGDAGDEVFGGYDTYRAFQMARYVPGTAVQAVRPLIERLPASDRKVTSFFKMKRFVRDFGSAPVRRHLDWMATFNDDSRRQLLGERFIGSEDLVPCQTGGDLLSLQLSDIHNYLSEDILKKVDLASMLNSLEVRVPFLDYRLVPLVLSLPAPFKIRRLTTKWLLKQIASRYVPRRIVHRPKRGFTSPISQWIKSSAWIREVIADQRCHGHDLLDHGLVQRMLDYHLAGTQDFARELWLVFVFNYWYCLHMAFGEGR